MIEHRKISSVELRRLIRNKTVKNAGNLRLKIYGTLQCSSGKRMKKENRVFFTDESEAFDHHFRPCGHCLREQYHRWKSQQQPG
jgi:methylphosphotriester-DNA--protein-cysteine methyltransferase